MTLDELRPTLLSLIPDVTASGLTLAEIMNVIQRRLIAGKALDTHLNQITVRLKAMTGVDVTNVDDGLALAEAKIKAGAEAQAENAYMHRILSGVKAKVGSLLLNQREKITDVCQALDVVQAEYAIVKDQSMRNAGLAAERENMISDVIGELRLILGTPKAEDLTLAKIMDLLKANHQRLCGAVHVLTTTPMDRVVNETVRALGARDYLVRNRLSRLCTDVAMDGKTTDEVLSMIEAQHKTLTERLGTSYAREIELTRDLTEAKTRLQTAGKESADLARALHLAEDKINGQSTRMGKLAGEVETLTRFRDDMRTVLGEPAATAKYMVDTVDEMRRDLTTIKNVLGMDRTVTTSDVVLQIGTHIKVLDRVRDAIGLRESAPLDYVVQRICDTRRDLHWAQGTLSMVKQALGLDGEYDRHTIMSGIESIIKAKKTAEDRHSAVLVGLCDDLDMPLHGSARVRDEIKARRKELAETKDALATLSNGLCDDLDMPTGDMDAVRKRVRDLVVFEQDVITTMGGSDRDQVRDGIGDSIKTLAQIVGLDPTVAALPVPGPLPYAIDTLTAIKDCLLAVVGHPGGESLSLNAALSLVQRKVSGVALALGLSEYASLDAIQRVSKNKIKVTREIMLKQCQRLAQVMGYGQGTEPALEMHVDKLMSMIANMAHALDMPKETTLPALIQRITCLAPIMAGYRARILTLLCEDPNRAGTMTTDEVVNLFKSRFACLAKNLSLPEDATLNTIMERIQNVIMDQFHGSAGAMPALRELVLTLHSTKAMDPNEAMTAAADKIKDLRQGLQDLLNAS